MTRWCIIRLSDMECVNSYIRDEQFGINDNDKPYFIEIGISEDYLPDVYHTFLKAVDDGNGNLSIVVNEPKYQQHKNEINEIAWKALREERNRLLKETDWVVLPDVEISQTLKNKLLEYRRLLRNIPQSDIDPETYIFPAFPS